MGGEYQKIILRYHEVALKGNNRGFFEKQLARNAVILIRKALSLKENPRYELRTGRILIHHPFSREVEEALSKTYGLSSFSPVKVIPSVLEEIVTNARQAARERLSSCNGLIRFRVTVKRSDKILGKDSVELQTLIGSEINALSKRFTVDLSNPDLTVGLEVRENESFLWTKRFRGPGGLPVGTNAKTLTLLSGGLDSPIAAIQILKRGASTALLHFHGAPFVGDESLEKTTDLARLIQNYAPYGARLYVVPIGTIQEQIALNTPAKYRTLLYRRLMMRIANLLAPQLDARAIVTGDNLGQVASQTIENMTVVDQASELPVLRPLLTWDKEDIIKEAKRIGSFVPSTKPAPDCCTLFADKRPATRASLGPVVEMESQIDIEALVREALSKSVQRVRFRDTLPVLFRNVDDSSSADQSTL